MHSYSASAAQFLDGAIRSPRDKPVGRVALQPVDLAQAKSQTNPVRPELVEGLSFLLHNRTRQPFDRLRANGCRFKRAIPIAVVHIDLAHLDTMFPRIADDLRGGVKAHWLRVEQGGGERRRV